MRTAPSHVYRQELRYFLRLLTTPEEEALLGVPMSYASMDDLEALHELVHGWHPRDRLAPPGYQARPFRTGRAP
jgi:hypothetical protein